MGLADLLTGRQRRVLTDALAAADRGGDQFNQSVYYGSEHGDPAAIAMRIPSQIAQGVGGGLDWLSEKAGGSSTIPGTALSGLADGTRMMLGETPTQTAANLILPGLAETEVPNRVIKGSLADAIAAAGSDMGRVLNSQSGKLHIGSGVQRFAGNPNAIFSTNEEGLKEMMHSLGTHLADPSSRQKLAQKLASKRYEAIDFGQGPVSLQDFVNNTSNSEAGFFHLHASPYSFEKPELRPRTGQGATIMGEGIYTSQSGGVHENYLNEFVAPRLILDKKIPINGDVINKLRDLGFSEAEASTANNLRFHQRAENLALPQAKQAAKLANEERLKRIIAEAASLPENAASDKWYANRELARLLAEKDAIGKGLLDRFTETRGAYSYLMETPDKALKNMIDADVPFYKQPGRVRDALMQALPEEDLSFWTRHLQHQIKSHDHFVKKALRGEFNPGGAGEVREKLERAGLEGVVFDDALSRTKPNLGERTKNYVIFNPENTRMDVLDKIFYNKGPVEYPWGDAGPGRLYRKRK